MGSATRKVASTQTRAFEQAPTGYSLGTNAGLGARVALDWGILPARGNRKSEGTRLRQKVRGAAG